MSEPNPIEKMRRYYQARAPWHVEYIGYTSDADLEALLAPIVRDAEGKDVLEIACGTGSRMDQVAKGDRGRMLAIEFPRSL